MREDLTVAPITRSVLFPGTFLGMPTMYAIMVGLFTYDATFILAQFILGPTIGGILVIFGRFAAKQDPFFFDIILASFRISRVLK